MRKREETWKEESAESKNGAGKKIRTKNRALVKGNKGGKKIWRRVLLTNITTHNHEPTHDKQQ